MALLILAALADPRDSLKKLMLKLQTFQASRLAGRGVWIVKEIPKKN